MKDTAYSFAREVDRQIEALAPDDYHRKFGRSKQLQEELYPISRLALQLKQPGLEVEVEAFEDDGPVDGYIRISGFREREFDVEVTCVYDYDESLRRELLVSEGSAPGAGDICRDKNSGKVLATLAAVNHDEHIGRISKAVMDRFRDKVSKSYGPNTALIIVFDEIKLYGRENWNRLFESVEKEGGLSGSVFLSVYLFNCATNELQRAACASTRTQSAPVLS